LIDHGETGESMFTDHGENEIDENEVRENVSSVQLSGQSRQSDTGGEPKMGGGSTYGISPQVLHASIPAMASMTHANSLSPNDFTRSFIVSLL
jgi:hypothetical protein